MKIYRSESRLREQADWLVSEFDSIVFDLMHKHYQSEEKAEEVLLSQVYEKLSEVQEIFTAYREMKGDYDE